MAGITGSIEIRILDLDQAKKLFAEAEAELVKYQKILREVDEWIRSRAEYCPLCTAVFSRCQDHDPDCGLAGLTVDPRPE